MVCQSFEFVNILAEGANLKEKCKGIRVQVESCEGGTQMLEALFQPHLSLSVPPSLAPAILACKSLKMPLLICQECSEMFSPYSSTTFPIVCSDNAPSPFRAPLQPHSLLGVGMGYLVLAPPVLWDEPFCIWD